jgi:ferredoxin-NADP reductase
VAEVVVESARARTLVLELPSWPGHRAGQHVDVRLTAEDGYSAQRGYSIASAPEDDQLELTVEQVENGEVSTYLTEELRAGDELELRGPIGGYFVWEERLGGPLLLVAGGSGVVPLRSILRHRQAVGSDVPARILYSARTLPDVLYRTELEQLGTQPGIDLQLTLTRGAPEGFTGRRGRIDRAVLQEVAWPPEQRPLTYVCGPTEFVELAAGALVELGHDPTRIKTERFG